MKDNTHKKKKSKALLVIISVLAFFAVLFAGGTWYANHYLNKITYADETLKVDPEIVTDAPLPETYTNADTEVDKNINDNRLWYDDDILNILLIGCDYGSSKQYYPRSDAVIIASINKIQQVINIVSLSRATYVAIPGYGHARLNAAYAYGGPDLLVKTIEQNYKVRIDKYVSINFEGFSKAVDALGGINIYLTADEVTYLKSLLPEKGIDLSSGAGNYNLDGQTALAYARIRKIDSDKMRTQRQRNIIKQIINKAKSSSVSQATKLLNEFLPLVSTNFSKYELLSNAAGGLKYARWPVSQSIIPHKGTHLVTVNGYEVLIFDWDVVKSDIHEQLYPGIEPKEPLVELN